MNPPPCMPSPGLCLRLAFIALVLSGCATTQEQTPDHPPAQGNRMMVRTTAYTHTEAGGAVNGIGGRLRFGGSVQSAAADWSWLPLGTRFRICNTGQVYVIEDYGSALVGRQTIDLYTPSRRAMNAWGVRQVEIEILEWGSHAMSLKLLEGRTGNSHVRAVAASFLAPRSPITYARTEA